MLRQGGRRRHAGCFGVARLAVFQTVAIVEAGVGVVVIGIAVDDIEFDFAGGFIGSHDQIVIGAAERRVIGRGKSDHSIRRLGVIIERLGKGVEHARFVGAGQESARAQNVKALGEPAHDLIRGEVVVQPDLRGSRIPIGNSKLCEGKAF